MSLLDDDLIKYDNFYFKHLTIKWLQKYSWGSTLKPHVSFGISFIKEEVFSAVKLIARKNKVYIYPYFKYPVILDESVKNNIPEYIDISKCQIYYCNLIERFK